MQTHHTHAHCSPVRCQWLWLCVDSVVRVSQPFISLEFTQATPAYKLKNAHVYAHVYMDTNQDKGTDKLKFKSKNQKQLLQTVLT